MYNRKCSNCFLSLIILFSLIFKLALIFIYGNNLTLYSDDLNYIKSAAVLIEKGIFTFHNFNEPTVFITPVYPLFLALVFRFFGYGYIGLQVVRILQAILSCITIAVVFLTAKYLFNRKAAFISAFVVAFYIPNIVTTGFILTETLFTLLLCTLVYLSLIFCEKPNVSKFALLGFLWGITTLCRPTIAFYPAFLFVHFMLNRKVKIYELLKLGLVMTMCFSVIITPWWIRNYLEYSDFIPLAASGGNPLLQGTYVNYEQHPHKIEHYKLGKNSFETNKIEIEVSKVRFIKEIKEDPLGYLRWYTIRKTYFLWGTIFYWRLYFNIGQYFVLATHYVLLLGFFGILIMLFTCFKKSFLPVSVILYFNVIHCVYMAFDRYAFPLLPLLAIFCAIFILKVNEILSHVSA